jgi:aspartokinase/homoserine dehydrogenase 1
MIGNRLIKKTFEVLSLEEIVILLPKPPREHSICIGILNEDAEAAEAVINRAEIGYYSTK